MIFRISGTESTIR